MKTKEITVERNFHIMNDDRFIMEKISQTIELEENDWEDEAINIARKLIESNFKAAYPNVYVHLNFDEKEIPITKAWQVDKPYIVGQINVHPDGSQTKIILDEPTPIDQSFNLIDEINKCKSKSMLKVYAPMVKSPDETEAYFSQLEKLSK